MVGKNLPHHREPFLKTGRQRSSLGRRVLVLGPIAIVASEQTMERAMKAHRRRVAGVITIATFLTVPSSTVDKAWSTAPMPQPASVRYVEGARSPRTASPASSPSRDEATREEKTIAWLILLLKQGHGVR